MRKIKYSQKPIKVNTKIKPIKNLKKKSDVLVVKKNLTPVAPIEDKLKIIHTLFGKKIAVKDQLAFQRRAYSEAKSLINQPWSKDNLHFTLEEHNRDFLLESGVPEKNVIWIKELPPKIPTNFSFFYRIFLFTKAAEMFPNNNFLSLDYDCHPAREFNKKDIYNILEENQKRDIQCPPVAYKNKAFTSIDGSRQCYGFQGCLVYWRDNGIIKKWFEMYLKNPDINNDEPVLLLTLETLYGKLSVDDLFSFNTRVITTRRIRNWSPYFNEQQSKDAYFWHG